MSRIDGLPMEHIKTGEVGVDEVGAYEVVRIVGEEYCNCHPETCCHFDGTVYVDYEKRVYITTEHLNEKL